MGAASCTGEWFAFLPRKNPSAKDTKTAVTRMRIGSCCFFMGIRPPGLTIMAKADIIHPLYTTFFHRTSPVLQY
jgi:hypothetical protein